MIATITSAGTPNSLCARASVAALVRQNSSPPSMRSRLKARMREQVREVMARESVLGDELGDEGARLGALIVAQRRDAFGRRGIERCRGQHRQREQQAP